MSAVKRLEKWVGVEKSRTYCIQGNVIELFGGQRAGWPGHMVVILASGLDVDMSGKLKPNQRIVPGGLSRRINAALDLWEELYGRD